MTVGRDCGLLASSWGCAPPWHSLTDPENWNIGLYRFIHMEEGLAEWKRASMEDEAEMALKSFRRPRNLLLCIVASYFQHNVTRLRVLRRLLADSSPRAPDTLDHRTHSVSIYITVFYLLLWHAQTRYESIAVINWDAKSLFFSGTPTRTPGCNVWHTDCVFKADLKEHLNFLN